MTADIVQLGREFQSIGDVDTWCLPFNRTTGAIFELRRQAHE